MVVIKDDTLGKLAKKRRKQSLVYDTQEAREYTKKRKKVPVGEIYETMKKKSSLFMWLEKYS